MAATSQDPPKASSPQARKTMTAQRQSDTAPELAVRSVLHRRGLRFWKHRAPVAGLRCKADVVFPRHRVAIFIDGCFWHGCSQHRSIPKVNASWWREKIARNVARDRRNDDLLIAMGWAVVRVWEHDDPAMAADTIEATIRERQSKSPASLRPSPASRPAR